MHTNVILTKDAHAQSNYTTKILKACFRRHLHQLARKWSESILHPRIPTGVSLQNGGLQNIWKLGGYKRKPGGPKKNCVDIIRRDLKDMDTTWDDAKEQTEQNGVNVWPNASIRMRDELRCKV